MPFQEAKRTVQGSPIATAIADLTTDKYVENSHEGIDALNAYIKESPDGVEEAIFALNRALDDPNVYRQLRALSILEQLVRGGCRAFQLRFPEDDLVNRLKEIAKSRSSDPGVSLKMMDIFRSWRKQFLHDPQMVYVCSLYAQCGGVDQVPKVATIGRGEYVPDLLSPSFTSPLVTVGDHMSAQTSVDGSIGVARKEADALLQAMLAAQARFEDILDDEAVHKHVSNVLDVQKSIVKFIHTVSDEEYLTMLVDANDRIVDVLQRLQMGGAGAEVPSGPLGVQLAAKEAVITQAARRLSLTDVDAIAMPAGNSSRNAARSELSRKVDTSLVLHSGFTTAAPSRNPGFEDYTIKETGRDAVDYEVAARNTRAMEGTYVEEAIAPDAAAPDAPAPAIRGAAPPILGTSLYS
ncbi:Lsb5p [Malassezia vespertilionis]|uniref:Lsb5p n=1 Tax=Malassezia vespertilionis TaxID=2020962 RepID=A0A2N1JGT5_9BASI|nr:Lsb5p [Malassezia vespertilionis]